LNAVVNCYFYLKRFFTLTFRNRLRKLLTGLSVSQEYVCIDSLSFDQPLSVFAWGNHGNHIDVTHTHLFLGYKPLLIGLVVNVDNPMTTWLQTNDEVTLTFQHQAHDLVLGRMTLAKKSTKLFHENVLIIFEGRSAMHRLISPIHQRLNGWRDAIRPKPAGNVGLPGNLYQQVQLAYATPRNISIISLSDGTLMNMFPTDLHGPIGDNYYTGSLRSGGKACAQVEQLKRIVVAVIDTRWYREAFLLGKNHMRSLADENEFDIHEQRSLKFGFALPHAVKLYRELTWLASEDHGIHRVHFYKVEHTQVIDERASVLSHIHMYYCQWRHDHGLVTHSLIR
jgi:hypothetical protein